jgi:hypothetical protein
MSEPIFMKLNVYIMAHEPSSTAYKKSFLSVCISKFVPPIVARQWLGKNITAAANTYATID